MSVVYLDVVDYFLDVRDRSSAAAAAAAVVEQQPISNKAANTSTSTGARNNLVL